MPESKELPVGMLPAHGEELLCISCRRVKTTRLLEVGEAKKPVCLNCFARFSETPAGGRYETAMRELHLVHEEYQGRIGGVGSDPMREEVVRWKALASIAFADWLRLEQVDCNAPRR